MDWALFYYCWVGVHRRGGQPVDTLSRTVDFVEESRYRFRDGLALLDSVGATAYAVHRMLGPSNAKSPGPSTRQRRKGLAEFSM